MRGMGWSTRRRKTGPRILCRAWRGLTLLARSQSKNGHDDLLPIHARHLLCLFTLSREALSRVARVEWRGYDSHAWI